MLCTLNLALHFNSVASNTLDKILLFLWHPISIVCCFTTWMNKEWWWNNNNSNNNNDKNKNRNEGDDDSNNKLKAYVVLSNVINLVSCGHVGKVLTYVWLWGTHGTLVGLWIQVDTEVMAQTAEPILLRKVPACSYCLQGNMSRVQTHLVRG
jgi:hypothetical protein